MDYTKEELTEIVKKIIMYHLKINSYETLFSFAEYGIEEIADEILKEMKCLKK